MLSEPAFQGCQFIGVTTSAWKAELRSSAGRDDDADDAAAASEQSPQHPDDELVEQLVEQAGNEGVDLVGLAGCRQVDQAGAGDQP